MHDPVVDIELPRLHEKLVNFSTGIFKRIPYALANYSNLLVYRQQGGSDTVSIHATGPRFMAWNLIGTPWKSRSCCGLMRSRKSVLISNQNSMIDNMKQIWN